MRNDILSRFLIQGLRRIPESPKLVRPILGVKYQHLRSCFAVPRIKTFFARSAVFGALHAVSLAVSRGEDYELAKM